MANDPLFIVGTERSGSNLLRLILNAHPRIHVPHPPHLMRYFAHIEASYGPFEDPDTFRCLVADMIRLIDAHIYPWDDVALDVDDLVDAAEPRDLFGAVAAIYDRSLAVSGKARWGCKSTFMVHHVERVLASYPNARFILLVRDVRDVVVSSRKSVFSPCHPLYSAQLWRDQQQEGLELLERVSPEVILVVRYEELLEDGEACVKKICAHLDEAYHPDCLRFFETGAAKKGASLSESWGNTASPILKGNSGRYRSALTADEIALVESVACEQMRAFDYALDTPQEVLEQISIGPMLRLQAGILERYLRAGIEWRSLRKDKNHWRRWRRDATAAWLALGRTEASSR